jgi:hypothetical protein
MIRALLSDLKLSGLSAMFLGQGALLRFIALSDEGTGHGCFIVLSSAMVTHQRSRAAGCMALIVARMKCCS